MSITVLGAAINTQFWEEMYDQLSSNDATLTMIFVGHIRPTFSLPENFIYIYSDSRLPACSEIAYRRAYATDSQYIMFTADDMLYQDGFLDKLIESHQNAQSEHDCHVIVGPQSYRPDDRGLGRDRKHMMSLYPGGPIMLTASIMTVETSKELGVLDSRFKTLYSDVDRMLRAHEKGYKLILDEQLPPAHERSHKGRTRAFNISGRKDQDILKSLWNFDEIKKTGVFKRRDRVIGFTEEQLQSSS